MANGCVPLTLSTVRFCISGVRWGRRRALTIMDNARSKKSRSNLGSKIFIALLFMASTIIIGMFYYYNPDHRFEIRANWMVTKWNNDLEEDPECGYIIRRHWPYRLGNVMFQYASFYGMIHEYRQNRPMTTDRRKIVFASSMPQLLQDAFENLSLFHFSNDDNETHRLLASSSRVVNLNENACCRFEPIDWSKFECDNVSYEIRGNRQSFKYFENVRDEVRREFLLHFRKSVRDECDRRFEQIVTKHPDCMIVGVHLRRGDFTSPGVMNAGHVPASERYFQRAVRFFEETYYSNLLHVDPNVKCLVFLILGNDHPWNVRVAKNLTLLYPNSTRFEFIDFNKSSPAVDLCLLSKCDHVAIATGTYGWMGAFLSRGIVTYQREYAQYGHRALMDPRGFYLDDWIPL